MKIEFKSPLSIDKCIEKIHEARKRNPSSIFLYHPILPFPSDIQDNKICIGYRSNGRNSFSQVFIGEFSSKSNSQTFLTGQLVLHPFVKGFMVLWIGLASFFASLFIVLNIKESTLGNSVPQINFFDLAILLPIFGVLIVLSGFILGQSEGKKIIELLENTLQATSIEKISKSTIFSKSNIVSASAMAIFILSGVNLGFSTDPNKKKSAEAELISFYTCSVPFENECTVTNVFSKETEDIYACGFLQTSSQSKFDIYWYHEAKERPIYYVYDIWHEQGFFCEQLIINEYISGKYTVEIYQGRKVLGEYKFIVK
ncbi:MAG: hypothetical protein KF758_16585 [Anaerolineales bacterium]|nr:hypothetical protein [Anaerolineales bacterium]MBX3038530.1 hypothetical protein [Anaerolineales bacterium]